MSDQQSVSCHSFPFRSDPRTVPGPSRCCVAFLSSATVPPGSSCVEGPGSKEILIVISQANDLWSIFRPEPYDWGGSGPFSWMRNESFASLARRRPPPRCWRVCKALSRGLVNYSTLRSPCIPAATTPLSSLSLSPVPSTGKCRWVIELFADGTISTIFNLKATHHKSKQTFLRPEWLMQFNILM